MRKSLLNTSLMLAVLLLTAGFSVSQTAQNRTLVVNGQSGQVAVLQIEGRSFVDIAALAQVANGSLGFQGNRITLTLPAASAGTPPSSSSPPPSGGSAFSKTFMKAGIEFMSVIREWRSAQANALQNGFQVSLAGIPASVPYAGMALGYVGLYQFNVVVPNTAASDAVPLTFTLGSSTGQQVLYTAVQ